MSILAAINWHSFFFLLLGLLACVFALMVLFSNNVVRMAFYLVLCLSCVAGLFFLAGAHFVGAMQVMIYVGGTLVLLVFGVMLTAQRAFLRMQTRAGDWLLAMGAGAALLAILVQVSFGVPAWRASPVTADQVAPDDVHTTARLGLGLVGVRTDRLDEEDEILAEGMSGYLFPFLIISVHLLVVLVGAAYLARTTRRVSAESVAPEQPLPEQGTP